MKTVMEACETFLEILRRENATMEFRELENFVRYALIRHTLEVHGGNQCQAALEMGVHRNTLARYIEQMIAAGFPNPVHRPAPKKKAHGDRRHRSAA